METLQCHNTKLKMRLILFSWLRTLVVTIILVKNVSSSPTTTGQPEIYYEDVNNDISEDENEPVPTTTIERSQELGKKMWVSWTVDFLNDSATFEVTAETMGYIGFGLSPQGGMNNADMVIGGVKDDGEPYFTDRFSTSKSEPKIDHHQDWHLIEATENGTHTLLRFNRSLTSCDPEDHAITNDTTKFIWALGDSDDISYHSERGVASVNILDLSTSDVETSEFDVWHIDVNTTMQSKDTSYWCTVHKAPSYDSKRHIVGFKVKLDNDESLTHNHHLVLHKCTAGDPKIDKSLESFVTKPGGECYNDDGSGMRAITRHCTTFLYVWAKGGRPLFLPENVGLPLKEEGGPEYFLLEIHYDNPKILKNLGYDTGLQVFTTSNLRKEDAGLLTIGSSYTFTLTIPPASKNFVITGQCSSLCTVNEVPAEGINIFNVLLHSHLSGRKLKLRHFRPDADTDNFTELPWVSYDNNYDFDYQQNRPLRQHRKILPGDHLTYECTYDSTWKKKPSVTLGALSTTDEMCESFLLYYPRMKELDFCGSQVNQKQYLTQFGIQSIDIKLSYRDPLIVKPEDKANLTISNFLNTKVDWTHELRKGWQEISRYGHHDEICYGRGKKWPSGNGSTTLVSTTYPKYSRPFEPVSPSCPSAQS